MTVRPSRPDSSDALGESFSRTRSLERQAHGPWIYVGLGLLNGDGTFSFTFPNEDSSILDGDGYPFPRYISAPDFINGWMNAGGGMQRVRFRWTLAGGIDIQGSAAGGTYGTAMFVLPAGPLYRPQDGSIRIQASDDAGGFVPVTITTGGSVIGGVF